MFSSKRLIITIYSFVSWTHLKLILCVVQNRYHMDIQLTVSATFVEKTSFSPLNHLDTFIKNRLTAMCNFVNNFGYSFVSCTTKTLSFILCMLKLVSSSPNFNLYFQVFLATKIHVFSYTLWNQHISFYQTKVCCISGC